MSICRFHVFLKPWRLYRISAMQILHVMARTPLLLLFLRRLYVCERMSRLCFYVHWTDYQSRHCFRGLENLSSRRFPTLTPLDKTSSFVQQSTPFVSKAGPFNLIFLFCNGDTCIPLRARHEQIITWLRSDKVKMSTQSQFDQNWSQNCYALSA